MKRALGALAPRHCVSAFTDRFCKGGTVIFKAIFKAKIALPLLISHLRMNNVPLSDKCIPCKFPAHHQNS